MPRYQHGIQSTVIKGTLMGVIKKKLIVSSILSAHIGLSRLALDCQPFFHMVDDQPFIKKSKKKRTYDLRSVRNG